jgi:hypothetical protein
LAGKNRQVFSSGFEALMKGQTGFGQVSMIVWRQGFSRSGVKMQKGGLIADRLFAPDLSPS